MFFEALVVVYGLYSFHVFCLCLSHSIIKEYEPLKKFYWFAFIVAVLTIQKSLIAVIYLLIYPDQIADGNVVSGEEAAAWIQSLLASVELFIGVLGLAYHFGIGSNQISEPGTPTTKH